MSAKVELVLPGLFDLPLGELEPGLLENELPHLNKVLRLATPRPNQAFSIDSILKTALDFDSPTQRLLPGLPIAQAFTDAEDQQPGHLLLSQAIHLQAGLHSAVIVPIPNNQDNLKDITLIINDLNDIFNVDCSITVIADGLFLVNLKGFEAPTHYPHILSVLGKTANPYIEQSRQILPWYRLLNEIQMYMHQHEVNTERLRRGLLSINSLWFWGAGSLPKAFDANLDWYCDDLVLNQFALSLRLMPKSCASVDKISDSVDSLVIDLRLMEFLKAGQAKTLDQLLLDIDTNLLKPLLLTTVKNRSHLVLRAGYETDFEMRPSARMKFWRRDKSLSYWSGYSDEP